MDQQARDDALLDLLQSIPTGGGQADRQSAVDGDPVLDALNAIGGPEFSADAEGFVPNDPVLLAFAGLGRDVGVAGLGMPSLVAETVGRPTLGRGRPPGDSEPLPPLDEVFLYPPPWGVIQPTCLEEPQLCLPPFLHPQSGLVLEVAEFQHIVDAVMIDGALHEESQLLQTSWALMIRNFDLAEWAFCQFRGAKGSELFWKGGWIRPGVGPLIMGTTANKVMIKVLGWSDESCSKDSSFAGVWDIVSGGKIKICRVASDTLWCRLINAWKSNDSQDKTCAVLRTAASLFHELLHFSGMENNKVQHAQAPCDDVYVVQSIYLWALLRRYSAAVAQSACCSLYFVEGVQPPFVDSSLYAYDVSETISNDCLGFESDGAQMCELAPLPPTADDWP